MRPEALRGSSFWQTGGRSRVVDRPWVRGRSGIMACVRIARVSASRLANRLCAAPSCALSLAIERGALAAVGAVVDRSADGGDSATHSRASN
jgi:hypothetical protein